MKKFLKYLIILFSSIIIILYGLDAIYTYVYTNNTSPRNKAQYLLSLKNKKIDYIFLGSSRVENHINTKLVEQLTGKKALNLGTQGASLDDIYLFLKLLEFQNVKADKIFIQVDYNFNQETPSSIVSTVSLPYINKNQVVDAHVKKSNDKYLLYKYIPFYKYATTDFALGFREVFNTIIRKKARIDFSNGFDPRLGQYKNQKFILPEYINKDNKILNLIDSYSKAKGIKIIYFTAPFCTQTVNIEYIEKLKVIRPDLYNFSNVLHNDLLYFDDCGHLSKSGADEFTKLLINTINL